jgi:hypothetical protein
MKIAFFRAVTFSAINYSSLNVSACNLKVQAFCKLTLFFGSKYFGVRWSFLKQRLFFQSAMQAF